MKNSQRDRLAEPHAPATSTTQGSRTNSRDPRVRDLELTRIAINDEPWPYYGKYVPTIDNNTRVPLEQTNCDKRKQLIELYKEILDLIKKNKAKITPPVLVNKEPKETILVSVPSESQVQQRTAKERVHSSDGGTTKVQVDEKVVTGRLSVNRVTTTSVESDTVQHHSRGSHINALNTLTEKDTSYSDPNFISPLDALPSKRSTELSHKDQQSVIGSSPIPTDSDGDLNSDPMSLISDAELTSGTENTGLTSSSYMDENVYTDSDTLEETHQENRSLTDASSTGDSNIETYDQDGLTPHFDNVEIRSSIAPSNRDSLSPTSSIAPSHTDTLSSNASAISSTLKSREGNTTESSNDIQRHDDISSDNETMVDMSSLQKGAESSNEDCPVSTSSAPLENSIVKNNIERSETASRSPVLSHKSLQSTPLSSLQESHSIPKEMSDGTPDSLSVCDNQHTDQEHVSDSETWSISSYSETPSVEYENSIKRLNTQGQPMTEQKRHMMDVLLLLLENVPILKDLPKERLYDLLPYFKLQSYPPRAAIILAGEKPRYFYILASGTVSAYSYEGFDKPNRLLRKYLNTDYFGELSLMNKRACTSYIIAESHVTLQAMSGRNFLKHLSDLFPQFRERALAEYGSDHTNAPSIVGAPGYTKAFEEFADVAKFMSTVPILSKIPNQETFVQMFGYKKLAEGEVVAESISDLRDFCVVYQGKLIAQLNDSEDSDSRNFAILGPTSFIGGVPFMHPQVVQTMDAASLVANGDTILFTLDGTLFKERCKSSITHVCDYIEKYFLDKLQERELLQGVENLSARLGQTTHPESASLTSTPEHSSIDSFIDDSSEDDLISDEESPTLGSSVHSRSEASPSLSSSIVDMNSENQQETDSDRSSALTVATDVESVASHKEPLESHTATSELCSISSTISDATPENTKEPSSMQSDSFESSGMSELSDTASLSSSKITDEQSDKLSQSDDTSDHTSITIQESHLDVSDMSSFTDEVLTSSSASISKSLDTDDDSSSITSNVASETSILESIVKSKGNDKKKINEGNRGAARFVRNTKRVPTGIFTRGTKVACANRFNGPETTIVFSEESPSDTRGIANATLDNSDDLLSDGSESSDLSCSSDDIMGYYSDGDSAITPKSYGDDDLGAIKALLIATLRSKYPSLAAAFHSMDADNCGVVFRLRFYEFIDELCVASFDVADLPYLFDMLREPDREVMTMASLYTNSGEHVTNAREMYDRLKNVYGSARIAFEKQFGPLKMSSTCAETDFLIVSANVGVSEDEAKKIFKELDVCGNGYVTVMTMLKLMRGDWTVDVAIEKETTAVSSYNQILGYWQNDDYETFRKEFSNPYISVFDILDYGVDVSLVDSSWEEFTVLNKDLTGIERYMDSVIIPAVESNAYFKMLSVIQHRFIATLFAEHRQKGGTVILSPGDVDYPLYILLSGRVESTYTTYLYMESSTVNVEVGSWLDFDSFVQAQPATMTYKVGTGKSALFGHITRAIFNEAIAPMVEARSKRVPVISMFLSKVPCLEGLDHAEIERISCACVVRKRKIHETIFYEGDRPDWFYIVFDGFVDVKLPDVPEKAAMTLSTTALLGAEEATGKMSTYITTVVVNSPTVLLLGWPVIAFDSLFGSAMERITEAAQQVSIERTNILKQMLDESKKAPMKDTKTVSFLIDTPSSND
ncbi:cyclic nucleotide-binding domain-containing, putative [Babesia ovis]|uniref:Cyclic nucleotide-binding domain-containing, putative n=1 Tax=Babesia ovis TaxID=5869 RepID=A0A9W5TAY5_BABOV|nr:cyclic nucleotide-binding domain-containing, putative [Babesia ovis]